MRQAIARRKTLKHGIAQLRRCEKALKGIFPQLQSLKTPNAANIEPNLTSEDPEKPYRTLKGDYVRSKSELIIANELYSHQISYTYEQPLLFNGYQYPIHPDFTISVPGPQSTVYWEHCGLMSVPEFPSGRKISLSPTSLRPATWILTRFGS